MAEVSFSDIGEVASLLTAADTVDAWSAAAGGRALFCHRAASHWMLSGRLLCVPASV